MWFFKCPYQAKVMKKFEIESNRMGKRGFTERAPFPKLGS